MARGLLETCLCDLGGLLWIDACFLGLLGGPRCDLGWPWGPFGLLLVAFWTIWELLDGPWLLFGGSISENVEL